MAPWGYLSVAVLICAIAFVLRDPLSLMLHKGDGPRELHKQFKHIEDAIKGTIAPVQWEPTKDFGKHFSKLGKPVVLRNTVVETWRARKLWNPDYFTRFAPTKDDYEKIFRDEPITGPLPSVEGRGWLTNIKRHTERIIHHVNPDLAFGSLRGVEWKKPFTELLNMSATDFFKEVSNSKDNFLYYSGSLSLLGERFVNDVKPYEHLMVSEEGQNMQLWIGGGNVTAHLHYDSPENFYVQLYGRKRFILFEPSEHQNLYLYPRLHPKYRQSQIDFEDIQLDRFPRFVNATAYEVVLQPGDILYIPPLWFHYVVAPELSISVNMWTDSAEYRSISEALRQPLPLESEWSRETLLAATIDYIQVIASKLHDRDTQPWLKKLLYRNRYEPLLNTDLKKVKPSLEKCPKPFTKDAALTRKFSEYATKVASLFLQLRDHGAREILFGNYVEELLDFLAGTENVAYVLAKCM